MARGGAGKHRLAGWPGWPGWPAIAAAVAAIMVAGCASLPSGGAPQQVSGASEQAQAFVLPQPPPPPTRTWSQKNVVLGFLHASASYAIDPSAANDYLVRSLRNHWHHGPMTVVGSPAKFVVTPPPQKLVNGSGQPETTTNTVTVTAQRIATLSQSGQYEYEPAWQTYIFTLAHVDGVWLIKGLPPGGPLLIQSDFEQLYQQRNLYFNAPTSAGNYPDLVPDPVYAPIGGSDTALNTTVARNLVRGLLQDSNGWLTRPATTTAFPPGTQLKELTISNQTAVVNLGGAAARASPFAQGEMYEQLRATLTVNSGYSTPVANQVDLEFNGRTLYTTDLPKNLIPEVSTGTEPVYFSEHGSSVAFLADGHEEQVGFGPGQLAGAQVTAVASNPVSRSGTYNQLAIAVAAGNGCTVYTGSVGGQPAYRYSVSHHYSLSTSGGPCTSLSWDSSGYLWASSGRGIWAMRGKHAVRVSPPVMPVTGKKVTVLALRLAPDAVRAALLVKTGGSSHAAILLAAVLHSRHGAISFGQAVTAGTELADPLALSWLNPYYLAVLSNSQLYQVPLIGTAFTDQGLAPYGAQTLTTNGSQFVLGTAGGQIMTSSLSVSNWTHGPAGRNPAYPG